MDGGVEIYKSNGNNNLRGFFTRKITHLQIITV